MYIFMIICMTDNYWGKGVFEGARKRWLEDEEKDLPTL